MILDEKYLGEAIKAELDKKEKESKENVEMYKELYLKEKQKRLRARHKNRIANKKIKELEELLLEKDKKIEELKLESKRYRDMAVRLEKEKTRLNNLALRGKKQMECECGCEEVREENHVYDGYGVVEYDIVCAECGAYLGHWAYGTVFIDD